MLTSKGDPLLKTGITLEVFKLSGKTMINQKCKFFLVLSNIGLFSIAPYRVLANNLLCLFGTSSLILFMIGFTIASERENHCCHNSWKSNSLEGVIQKGSDEEM